MQAPAWGLEKLAEYALQIGFRPEHGVGSPKNLIGFDDYRDFPNITRGLVARGYSDDDIRGILGGNFLRVFEQVCG
jgi:membrane dipeptidase